MKYILCLIFLAQLKTSIYSQTDIVFINQKTKKIQLDKIGKPEHFKTFNLLGYAPLILRKPIYFQKNKIVYPHGIKKSVDIAFAEISFNSNINKQLAESYYFLVVNYKTKYPEVFMSKQGEMDFSNNNKIITTKKRVCDFSIGTNKGKTEFIIDYNKKLSYGIGFSETTDTLNMVNPKYSIPVWENYIKYGVLKTEDDSVCIALYDENRNGIFNEIDIDHIILTKYKNAPFFEINETFGAMKIASSNCINVKDEFFNVTYLSPNGTSILAEKIEQPTNNSCIRIFDRVPDETFRNSDSSLVELNKYFESGKFLFVNIWTSYCESCIDNFTKIDSLVSTNNSTLKVLSLLNKSNFEDLKKLTVKYNLKSTNGLTNKSMNMSLHLSGYPYMVLFDKTGKLILQTNVIEDVISYLKKNG